jgi:UDP-N-acetylmuramyl pentapeptide synthase
MIEQSKCAWRALLTQFDIHNVQWDDHELNSIAGRRCVFQVPNGVDIIDAAYNANLTSMIESIKFLTENFMKKKIAILGEMIFLDNRAQRYHEFLNCYLGDISLFCVGENMKFLHNKRILNGYESLWFESVDYLLEFLSSMHLKDVAILIKGSSDNHKSVYDLKRVCEYFYKLV